MVKYMGLGIACLTLVLSGVTQAVQIRTEKGICGKYDDQCYLDQKNCKDKGNQGVTLDLGVNLKDDCKKIEKDVCKDVKELKDLKDCKHDKKDHCKIEWKNLCEKHEICRDDKYDKHCDLIIDHGCRDHGCVDHCDPVAVPAPASSAMGGAGLIGIALMAFARSRRSINA
jgi:hypothetical protein